MANPYLAEPNPYIKSDNPYMESKESLWDRFVKATGAESDMMSSPANAEILRNVVGGGSAWIPAGVIKAAGIVSGQREGAEELANLVQEKIVGTPSTEVGKLAQKQIATPFEILSEKSQQAGDLVYDKTGSPLLATATRVAGEAIPFVAPVVVAKGLKGIKGAVKAPEIDLGKVSEKPYSITPDVERVAKVEKPVAETPKEVAPEIKAEAQKVEPAVDPLIEEARKYKSAEEFVNSQLYYHGTNKTFKEFKHTTNAELGRGYYFTPDMFAAQKFAWGKKVNQGGKQNIITVTPTFKKPLILGEGVDGKLALELWEKSSARNPNGGAIEKIAKDGGYDAIIRKGYGEGEEIMIFDKKNIKIQSQAATPEEVLSQTAETKADLTSIWNKAHEGVKAEIPKAETPLEGKPAKSAVDVNKVIAEKGFEALPDEELAKYNPITKADTISKIDTLLKADESSAIEMAKGNMPIPNDIQAQVLFNTVEKLAEQKGDIQTLMDLAKSPLAEQRSLSAQNLGASAWNKIKDTIVEKIQEVKKARESKITDVKMKEKVSKSLKEETQKINLSKEELSWDRFLSKIEC